ncbi:hypothetical protein C0993_010498 [Termitomyces sp. T159_Od127]|nr:hypothetical protein C0993_010498 [Termitomyces sp. T159_Od127]
MASAKAINGFLRCGLCSSRIGRRFLHHSNVRYAITNLEMPAMSPTMTEGGITSWKKREGEAFSAGDVLLEIETDKATIDVEAPDDGIMGKILLQDGAKGIPVGKVIALLAEAGDDISNLEVPKEEKPAPRTQASTPRPPSPEPVRATPSPSPSSPTTPQTHSSHSVSHSRPIFPSVQRLLMEFSITKPEDIKGTGVRGMLTKGDVLTYLGKASGPTGTFKESTSHLTAETTPGLKKEELKAFDGAAIRRLIVSTMLERSIAARNARPGESSVYATSRVTDTSVTATQTAIDFDSIIEDYLPATVTIPKAPTSQIAPSPPIDYLDGLY